MNSKNFQVKILGQNEHAIRYRILADETALTFEEVFQLWRESEAFRTFYWSILIDSEFEGIYWEHPGLNSSYLQKPYEFILQASKSLDKMPLNTKAFSEYFYEDKLIVDFDNLGKNARLIVPTPQTDFESYKHLAKFIRSNKHSTSAKRLTNRN